MNLGKLLGAGKSFISGNNAAAYRADKRVYLPRFGSPKNPFANSSTPAVQCELPKPVADKFPAPAKIISPSAAPARAATWVSKLNPVSIFRAPVAPEQAAPVQVELSLEKVKVVHNDLTDADVEIVPMKSRPAREPAADMSPQKKSWSSLGERIMKATAL